MHLEWNKQSSVTLQQTKSILGLSDSHTRLILHRLTQKHWLAPIARGVYELIPATRGEYAFVDTSPYFAGSLLVSPYYFAYSTAAYFHGLSTQAPAVVYLATTVGKTIIRRVRDRDYRIVRLTKESFFGFSEVDALGQRVWMSDIEKTILDCLHRPQYAGGIPEVAAHLSRGHTSIQWDRLIDYAVRFQSAPLHQRLGYLCDIVKAPLTKGKRKTLLSRTGQSMTYLGSLQQWGKGGRFDPTWRIIDNIPRRELLAELAGPL